MTTVAVLCDPPRPGLVLPRLAETSPLAPGECADVYAAMLRDVAAAVAASGGELLVNYRPDESLPEAHRGGDAEAEVRDALGDAVDPEAARFEVQVGETFAGRAGNTATHLLDREAVGSVALAEPTAPTLSRTVIDSAAMKLRRSEAVLGPAPGGRVYYAAFAAPIDYADAYAAPAVETLTDRARDAGLDVDFLPIHPVVETGADLASVLALVNARRRAGRAVPDHTVACLDDLGVSLAADDGALGLAR